MPQQVLPSITDFEQFAGIMKEYGFRELTGVEFTKSFTRLGLRAPRPRPGREVGFVYTANELTVFVWTTWLAREQEARKADAGWIVIAQRGNARYFNHPRHRTKNFLTNLLFDARVARLRVLNRPLCPACKGFMDIVQGRGMKARYWRCDRVFEHEDHKRRSRGWDDGLPLEVKNYLKLIRRQRARYRETLRREGKQPFAAVLNRKPWMASRNS